MDNSLIWHFDQRFLGMQNTDTEFGRISLEQIDSNRGNWRCTSLLMPGKHNKILKMIPLYYFDEAIAKAEIAFWIELAKGFCNLDKDPDIRITHKAEKLYHGKLCMVTVGKFYTMPKEYFAGQYIAVTVPPDLEPWLTVDYNDQFPRHYLAPTWAQLEAEQWLETRDQFQQNVPWLKLNSSYLDVG